MTSTTSSGKALVTVKVRRAGSHCPFGNEGIEFALHPGTCLWLRGPSGRGKSTLTMHLAGLVSPKVLQRLNVEMECVWDDSLSLSERCGVLFQQTTLLDELTVAGNLALALEVTGAAAVSPTSGTDRHPVGRRLDERDGRIKGLLDAVGLQYENDGGKRAAQLSGGMGRRAALALQLSQQKHVIVLDEPFAGLDHETAVSVARELRQLRQTGTALVLISHEWDIAQHVLGGGGGAGESEDTTERTTTTISNNNIVIDLDEPPLSKQQRQRQIPRHMHFNWVFGIHFRDRFVEKLLDYLVWSLPLILTTFTACGMAISMLSADTLRRIDVSGQVLNIVDSEIRPMLKMLTGEEANAFHVLGVKMKVSSMLNATVPPAKATLYAMGMAKLFVLEIGPLLSALLLSGRIGGSYAGKVAMMQATKQNALLRTIGVSDVAWSLYPALAAAVLAGPILTAAGTLLALVLAGHVGPNYYNIGTVESYWETVRDTVFPDLRLRGLVALEHSSTKSIPWYLASYYLTTFSSNWIDTLLEITTYPPIYHVLKAVTFMIIIMGVAEIAARSQPNVTYRGVPAVITHSVVTSGLLIILADWGFSRLWLKRV
jgi:ABC-type nitrate/sulfonate/bicarbonate transport system ATPase subunit/ABC-type transporter Mla maintaining outer membrane lipid asymmetry permease subunit MlaE